MARATLNITPSVHKLLSTTIPSSISSLNRINAVYGQMKWSGIIGIGQSLAVGYQGDLDEETSPIPHAFKLVDLADEYDITKDESDALTLAPLTEPFRMRTHGTRDVYPDNVAGQTPHSAMAAQITMLSRTSPLMTIHSCCAEGGKEIAAIKKGGSTNCYAASIFEAKAINRLAHHQKHNMSYDALILTHGETDAVLNQEDYGKDLIKLHADYCKDLMAITGQSRGPIMILSQQQTCPLACDVDSKVIQDQWQVEEDIVCSGPKYQYGYAPTNLHLPVGGYNRLGEKYGQVFHETVVEGRRFVPLSPSSISRRGAMTLVITFHVPSPPLLWDEHLPKPHQQHNTAWADGHGFEVLNSQHMQVKILHAAIEPDGESVALHLGAGHEASPLRVGYAMTGDVDAGWSSFYGGCAEGRIGHLCDSDPLRGAFTETLHCKMRHGSSELACDSRSFKRRAKYDVINSGEAVLMEVGDKKGVMDRSWRGTTGEHALTFHHNQRNFLVSFYGLSVE